MLHLDPAHAAADAAPTDPPPPDQRAAARVLAEAQIVMLTRLAEMGMEVAEAARDRAVALADDAPAAATAATNDHRDPALAFARAARAVRMTIALQARLSKDLLDLDQAETKARAHQAFVRRERIHHLVERAIEAEHDDEVVIEHLSDEARERLRDEDEYGDVMSRPVAETVARICADLGVGADVRFLTRETGEGDRGTRWRGRPLPQSSAERPPTPYPSTPTWPQSEARGPPGL